MSKLSIRESYIVDVFVYFANSTIIESELMLVENFDAMSKLKSWMQNRGLLLNMFVIVWECFIYLTYFRGALFENAEFHSP